METRLLDKGAGRWCVHTVEGDVHLAKLHYRGQGDWRCICSKDAEEGIDNEIEWAVIASTVEEAHTEAIKKVTENGVLRKLEEMRATHGRLPTADEIEADEYAEKVKAITAEGMLRSLLIHQLQLFYGHARDINQGAKCITTLTEVLAVMIVEHVNDEGLLTVKAAALEQLASELDEQIERKRKTTAEIARARDGLSSLIKMFTGDLNEDEDTASPPKH